MRVLAAMSGGVDSSVAAALLVDQGHDVVGATLKLWGGAADRGCCSVSDVDDARRVAHQLGIDHYVFGMADEFAAAVVEPYVAAHAAGRTPNPCIECNRHLKFSALLDRAVGLGFDAVATGHHVRLAHDGSGRLALRRGADRAKDQSYVLYMLDQTRLARCRFPIGHLHKDRVRAIAADLGLRTAGKADSQDVCFIPASGAPAGGRRPFLEHRIPLHRGHVVDAAGTVVGEVDAVELVTIGQRRGLGLAGGGDRRYVLSVDVAARTVTVGSERDLLVDCQRLSAVSWAGGEAPAAGTEVLAQVSAHGTPAPAVLEEVPVGGSDGSHRLAVRWRSPQRAVAPGQAVVLYDGDVVLGGGTASAPAAATPAAP